MSSVSLLASVAAAGNAGAVERAEVVEELLANSVEPMRDAG
jgi:hypothetical protein